MTLLSDPPAPAPSRPDPAPSEDAHRGSRPGPRSVTTAPSPAQGQSRLALLPSFVAMLCLLAGSASLSAVLQEPSWVLPLVEVVGVIWLLGVGCRLLRSPAPVTVLVQFAGLLVTLTSLFTSSGIGGLIPTTAVFRDAGNLLRDAWAQILTTVPPAPTSEALTFLAVLALGTTALIVDFLVAEAGAPALVALPLLCLYSVPASIATDALPWWTFVAPALTYAALLACTGPSVVHRFGRVSLSLVVSGAMIAVLGAAAGVLVGDSVSGVGTEGKLPRGVASGGQIGLSPFTSLRGDLQQGEPVELLRVRDQPTDDYLRALALDQWNAGSDSGFTYGALTDDGDPRQGMNPALPGADPVPVQIESVNWSDDWLPIFAGTQRVSGIGDGWNYDQDLATVWQRGKVDPQSYTVLASFQVPSADDLRADTVSPSDRLLDTTGIQNSVRAEAARVTQDARTAFDKADALQKYFTDPANGFTYSLQVPQGISGDLLTDFLQNKQGYCEQYASAMAAMLRTVGVPSRVAVGFTQGRQQEDGTRVITTNDAHAWVEVRFDEHGWVRFDPTPLAGGTGRQNGFSDTAGTGTGTDGTDTETSPTDEPSVGTTTRTTDRDERQRGLNPDDGDTDASSTGTVLPGAAQSPTGLAAVPTFVWIVLAALAVVALLLLAPGVVRSRRRATRRRVAAAGGPRAAAAAWAEIEDLMVDHRVALVPTESMRTAANRLARIAGLSQTGRSHLRSLVVDAEHRWYAEQNSPVAVAARGEHLDLAITAVRQGLHQAIPLRFWERLVPRSVRPRI